LAWDTITPYHLGFREFSQAFEAFGFEDIHKGSMPFLPSKPGHVLDIGAGSGRDAAWFARRGWEVIAVEPADALRAEAARLHASLGIRWVNDSLPALPQVQRLGLAFDLIWLSGVWMHVPPADRARTMRKLAMFLRPGGRLVMTLRHGPSPDDRPMWPVDANEVERLGLDFGLALRVATERADDLGGRAEVKWQTVILDLPDDGAGALPLLRGVILRQEKSSTYKLALLRAIARIADVSPNVARDEGDHVELPLGLIALYWVRMYKPLVELKWSQLPGASVRFPSGDAYRLSNVGAAELRPGARFVGEAAVAVRRALADAARLIATMPARHLTYADDRPVFETALGRAPAGRGGIAIDQPFLWHFGTTRVPLCVWSALRRMAAWIEPMLVAEWARLMQGYATNQGRLGQESDAITALRWQEEERDTYFVRGILRDRLAAGKAVTCVWSGGAIGGETGCIDHCLPWSAWPCNDLWNLMPAKSKVNLQKSDRLVTSAVLNDAKPRILDWWDEAYMSSGEGIKARFAEEAAMSLPLQAGGTLELEDVFAALDFRRLRLKQDSQAPEWPR
jgi:SAM-dependent methyltransferase